MGRLHVLQRYHTLSGRRAGKHDVGLAERIAQTIEPDGSGTDELGEVRAAARRAVAHDDRPCAGPMERRRDPDAHVAGADDEDLLATQGPETLVDHLDRGVADRGRTLPDRRLVTDSLADAQCLTEEQVERRAHTAFVLGDLPGAANLAEDLALPEHGGVEAGRNLEEMPGSIVLVAAVQVRIELVG